MRTVTVEICVESPAGAAVAAAEGADRIELCQALSEGGLTPSHGAIRRARDAFARELVVLVRPRGGDFVVDADDLAQMQDDIRHAEELGADGVAVGCLLPDGDLDRHALEQLRATAPQLAFTCHRAFDHARDPTRALEQLIDLGYARVLTSGQEASALAGAALLQQLVEQARDRIRIMAGGGVRSHNVREIVERSGVRDVHLAAGAITPTPSRHCNPRVSLASASRAAGERTVTSASTIRSVLETLSGGPGGGYKS